MFWRPGLTFGRFPEGPIPNSRRHFSSGASRRLRSIFFRNAGSDRRLRTSPSRGYCWGLGLRETSRRLIPASKTSPNLSTGPRWLGDKCVRRMIGAFQKPVKHRGDHLRGPKVTNHRSGAQVRRIEPAKCREDHLRGTEGVKSSLRSTSSKTKACEASRRSPSGDRR